MSEMETHKGTLVPMSLKGATLEERAQDACRLLGYKLDDYDSWVEVLQDRGYRSAYIRGDTIYEIQDQEVDPYGFVEATKHPDGRIEYFMSWYNGGASMSEVLDDAVAKAEKDADV